MRIIIVTHHDRKEDPNCECDYCGISVWIEKPEWVLAPNFLSCVATYGDHYHDKGLQKAEGFVDALKSIFDTTEVVYESRADADNDYPPGS
jgi:hypothetical protein